METMEHPSGYVELSVLHADTKWEVMKVPPAHDGREQQESLAIAISISTAGLLPDPALRPS